MNAVLVADHPPAVGAGVPAVHRAARVLRALGVRERHDADHRGASVSELSRQLDVSKSTMSALLATLEQHNLVERDPATRRFRLGHAVLELAAALSADSDVREAAQSHLARLRRRSGETAILHLVTGDGRIVIAERDEPAAQLKVVAPIGTQLPHFAGSVAKVLLAALEPGEAETILGRHELPAFTPRSVVDRPAYLKELAGTRRRGYARENEEYLVGVSAVSAPVINHDGRTIGAISVACVKTRVGERLDELAEPVMDAAAQTSLRLGAPGEGRWRSHPRAGSLSR